MSNAEAIAKFLPNTTRQTLEGQQHNGEATAIAPALIAFFK